MLACESAGGAVRLQGHGIPRVVLLVVVRRCPSRDDGGSGVDRCRCIGVIDLVGSGHAGSGDGLGGDVGPGVGGVGEDVVAGIGAGKGEARYGNHLACCHVLIVEGAGSRSLFQNDCVFCIVFVVVVRGCSTRDDGGGGVDRCRGIGVIDLARSRHARCGDGLRGNVRGCRRRCVLKDVVASVCSGKGDSAYVDRFGRCGVFVGKVGGLREGHRVAGDDVGR